MELIDLVNSVIIFSNDLTQIVNFPTRTPDCDSRSRVLLDLFFSSDTSNCSTMAFPPLGNSQHGVASDTEDSTSRPLNFPFVKNFSKKSNLDVSNISLPVFPSRTSLERHDISVSPKMAKKIITNLDSSKSSGPDCIQ